MLSSVSLNTRQDFVEYIASPFNFNHDPICRSLSWKIGIIQPSWVGPTFKSKLPPKLEREKQLK